MKLRIQRDIDDIRNYLEADGERVGCINSVIYDRIHKGYQLEQIYKTSFPTVRCLHFAKFC